MTVQELIDELMKVEDKSKTIFVYSNDIYEDAKNIREYDDAILIFQLWNGKQARYLSTMASGISALVPD